MPGDAAEGPRGPAARQRADADGEPGPEASAQAFPRPPLGSRVTFPAAGLVLAVFGGVSQHRSRFL